MFDLDAASQPYNVGSRIRPFHASPARIARPARNHVRSGSSLCHGSSKAQTAEQNKWSMSAEGKWSELVDCRQRPATMGAKGHTINPRCIYDQCWCGSRTVSPHRERISEG